MSLKSYSEVIAKCSHCNFCQATCPVFLEDLLETHEPRARMELVRKALIEESIPVSDRLKEIIDRCLLCTSCTQTCPAGVPVHEVIVATREELYHGKRMNIAMRYILNKVMDDRGVHGVMGKLNALAGKLGILDEVPSPAPKAFEKKYRGVYTPEGERRARVAYYVGCATNSFNIDTGEDTVMVLRKNGIEVVIPEKLVCCGMPALGEGDIAKVRELMGKNIDILSKLDVDAVVVDCTSCGLMLKVEGPKLFPQEDPLKEKADALAAKVWEVTDYLSMMGLTVKPSPLELEFTYHVPCHRWMTKTVKDAPRTLLAQIPGATLVEMENPELCCGAGGGFFMENRELAGDIRSHKIAEIEATGVKTVVTQCPGCRFFINAPLKEYRVQHPISILAEAYK